MTRTPRRVLSPIGRPKLLTPKFAKSKTRSRILGSFIGAAIAEALGKACRNLSAKEISSWPVGEIKCTMTDWDAQTDITMLILQGFIGSPPLSHEGLDHIDFTAKLLQLSQKGSTELGTPKRYLGVTTENVMKLPEFQVSPEKAAALYWKRSGRDSAGNGAIMRAAAIGSLDWACEVEQTMEGAVRFAKVTHGDPRTHVTAAIIAGLMSLIVRDEFTGDDSIMTIVEAASNQLVNAEPILELEHVVLLQKYAWPDSLEEIELDQDSKVFCYKTLSVALWTLQQCVIAFPPESVLEQFQHNRQDLFVELIKRVQQYGGEVVTHVTLCAALIGAYLGFEALPTAWIQQVKLSEPLMEKCKEACNILDLEEEGQMENGIGNNDSGE